MAKLTEEEKRVLYEAQRIRERIRAEALEAGEISLEEANLQDEEDYAELHSYFRKKRRENDEDPEYDEESGYEEESEYDEDPEDEENSGDNAEYEDGSEYEEEAGYGADTEYREEPGYEDAEAEYEGEPGYGENTADGYDEDSTEYEDDQAEESEYEEVNYRRPGGDKRNYIEDYEDSGDEDVVREAAEHAEILRRDRVRREIRREEEKRSAREDKALRRVRRKEEAAYLKKRKKEERRRVRSQLQQREERENAFHEQPSRPVRKKKRSLPGRLFRFLLILLLIILLLFAGVYAGVRFLVSSANYQPYETTYAREADVVSDPMVKNILLIGTDSRVANDASRSDAMILVSLNLKTRKIVMTSILRDSYVTVPGVGQNRINHAYQVGGAALLIQTIEQNFKIGVDYYVQVDFYDFMDVIDAFGGVEIEVLQEELQYVNGYISELNHVENAQAGAEIYPEGYGFLDAAGTKVLTGRQALGYCRIRYIGTDFGRTDRQRRVLSQLMKKVKTQPWNIIKACQTVIPDLTTNIDDNTMALLAAAAPAFLFFDMEQFRVPADGCWWNDLMGGSQDVLGINFEANNAALIEKIYQ